MQQALAPTAPTASSSGRPRSAAAWQARLVRTLVGVPLFLKVLVANCVVVVLGVALGTWFTLSYVAGPNGTVHWPSIWLMAAVGFAASVLINAIVLWLALQPLYALERTVDRVASGDLDARARPVLFTDPDVERLGDTLNSMLDVLQGHRDQLQKLSEQVLAAQEDERKRIARELHDETAQSLTTLLVRLKMVERAKDPGTLHSSLHELRELTVQTLEAVRELAVELRPSTLDHLGLVAALESHADSYAARFPVMVDFAVHGFTEADGDRLPPQVELVLYRVVQEALTNVAKHAGAHHVAIRLERRPREVIATVEDDGHGFDVEDVMRSRERGLGLFGMQERLALVQGHLAIGRVEGGGTRVQATVPLGLAAALGSRRPSAAEGRARAAI